MANQQRTLAKGVRSLNTSLLEDYNQLGMGLLQPKIAKERANLAGKYLKGVSVRIEYKKLTGHKKEIDGIED